MNAGGTETSIPPPTLVQHANYHAEAQVERRLPKHRRREDFMIDDCKAD